MAKAENPLTEELAKFVKEKLDEWKVPGVSIGIIDNDQVFTAGYGTATLPDTPATPETLWYAGSTTKAFTGAVIAQLIDSKKYPALEKGWQTTISSILREDFVLQDEWATNHLTLEDAVSHRTGMPRHDQSAFRLLDDGDGGKRHATVKDVTRNLRNLRLSEEPRVKFQYCNLMYGVLSHVVETVTGKALGEVMREIIFEPLGMTSTYLSLDDARASPKHLSAGYYWDEKTNKYVLVEDVSVVEHGGAGAIISNTEDYVKWAKCMMLGEEPFSEAVHKDIRTPRIIQSSMPKDGKDVTTYALGWDRTLYHGHLMYSHGGGMMAAGCMVIWLPDDKLGLVGFGNTSITSNAVIDSVLYRLVDDKLGIDPEKRTDAAKGWQSVIDHFIGSYDKAMDRLFPKRPNPPIPSPISVKDLAGKYYDPGYKTIELRAEPHPEKQGEEILVAERDDATWRIHMKLHHVSGTWWIMYALQMGNPNLFRECEQVEFKIGHDGKVTALEVDYYSLIGNQHEGKVVFNRVEES